MLRHVILALGLASIAAPVLAAPDVVARILDPGTVPVYQAATYRVKVENTGRHTANVVNLRIELPLTNTSPDVHLMGSLSGVSSNCAVQRNILQCSLGRLRKNASTQVSFSLGLPQSSKPLVINAIASTSGDSNPGNNAASYVASLSNPATAINSPQPVTIRHCTGTNLSSFFECSLYSSSISQYQSVLDVNGLMQLPPDASTYTGFWSRPGGNNQRLWMDYFNNGLPALSFDGYAVGNNCFEGISTFANTTAWVAAWQVCF